MKYFKPKVGENIIRILPLEIRESYGDANDLFLYHNDPFAYPSLVHASPTGIVTCLEVWNEFCPIDEHIPKKVPRFKLLSQLRYYMNILVNGDVYVWCVGESVYKTLETYNTMVDYRGFISPEYGTNCSVIRKGEGLQTKYNIMFERERTPIDIDWSIEEKLCDFTELLCKPTQEQLQAFIKAID